MDKTVVRRWKRVLVMVLVLVTVGGGMAFHPAQASARVIQEHLQDGRILDKSFRALTDSNGYSWQLIAFTDTQAGVTEGPYLRMVGFPGAVSVDRDHPLVVSFPSGQTLMLDDVSFLIFKDGLLPQENVAQYNIGAVLETLPSPGSLRLAVPVFKPIESSRNSSEKFSQDSEPLEFSVSKSIVAEWIAIAP
ncbi:MAG: DUF3122 domain-containing protein [Leptolyngbyaceae bacterium]|nr:DUF3122 domain-containing protein [Leptolyngbyaceae bacterium]